jgi:hypothetical protein
VSTGARVPLENALALAVYVMQRWQMTVGPCAVVGSVRRNKPEVGDLEIIAPMPAAGDSDTLWFTIAGTLGGGGDLFSGTKPALAVPVRGFKRLFLHASLMVTATGKGVTTVLPVEIYRYAHDGSNRGWIELMRTGPADFGKWFLWQWKRRFEIPQDRQASIDGHLVDRDGERVETRSEGACFERLGIEFIEPQAREEIA